MKRGGKFSSSFLPGLQNSSDVRSEADRLTAVVSSCFLFCFFPTTFQLFFSRQEKR